MKNRFIPLIAILATILALNCCSLDGSDGKIYGQYDYEAGSTVNALRLGGFPDVTLNRLTSYEIKEGTYDVYYSLNNGGQYWPGNAAGTGGTDSGYLWHGSYTVAVNKGSFMNNGLDKEFLLFLDKSAGLQLKSGAATVGGKSTEKADGTATNGVTASVSPAVWSSADGAVTVTVTSDIVRRQSAKY